LACAEPEKQVFCGNYLQIGIALVCRERDYCISDLGRKRTDLLIEWPLIEAQGFLGPVQRIVLELKIWRRGRNFEILLQEGIAQTKGYSAQVGADEAHLIIFDRNPERPWDEKIWQKDVDGLPVWGC
jgi:hypothetical protein